MYEQLDLDFWLEMMEETSRFYFLTYPEKLCRPLSESIEIEQMYLMGGEL
jgi:hypothetical protein